MSADRSHEFTRGLYGWITHTDLSSTDPGQPGSGASRCWAGTSGPFASLNGDYHLFAYSESGGGGVRQAAPGEQPGSTPTVHVDDTQAAFDAGAEPISLPERVMAGVCIAMVRAPGGVLIGFSGPTD